MIEGHVFFMIFIFSSIINIEREGRAICLRVFHQIEILSDFEVMLSYMKLNYIKLKWIKLNEMKWNEIEVN